MGVLISFVLFCFLFVSGFVIYLCRYPKKYFIFVICCLILTWLTITDNFGYLTIPSFIRCLSVHPLTFPFSAFLPFFIPYFALALELNSHCSTWFWSTIFSTNNVPQYVLLIWAKKSLKLSIEEWKYNNRLCIRCRYSFCLHPLSNSSLWHYFV